MKDFKKKYKNAELAPLLAKRKELEHQMDELNGIMLTAMETRGKINEELYYIERLIEAVKMIADYKNLQGEVKNN